jgi:hypothetical protein
MLQSLYTTAVVNQLVDDRVQTAARQRRAPARRRIFGRGGRAAAPLSSPHGRLRVSGAGR